MSSKKISNTNIKWLQLAYAGEKSNIKDTMKLRQAKTASVWEKNMYIHMYVCVYIFSNLPRRVT